MDDDRERLKRLLVRYALKNSERILASGQISSYFIEVRRVTLSSLGTFLIGKVFLEKIRELELRPKAVGGTESAMAIAVATSRASYDLPLDERIDVYAIRRQPDKAFFGDQSCLVDGFQQKDSVLVLEDVTTTGMFTVKTVQKVRAAGLKVRAVVSLVDREEGAAGIIKNYCPFYPIFRASELFECKEGLGQGFEYNESNESVISGEVI